MKPLSGILLIRPFQQGNSFFGAKPCYLQEEDAYRLWKI